MASVSRRGLWQACALGFCVFFAAGSANANCYVTNLQKENEGLLTLTNGQNVVCDGAAPNPYLGNIEPDKTNYFGIGVKLQADAKFNGSITLYDQSVVSLSGQSNITSSP